MTAPRRFRELVTVHDLEHLATLSSARDLWLNVSERTLYLLQNYACDDILDVSRYAVERGQESYTPLVDESDSDWPLYFETVENAQVELLEETPPVTSYPSTLVVLDTPSATLPSAQWVDIVWSNLIQDSYPGDWQGSPSNYFQPVKPGWYVFEYTFLLNASAAWTLSQKLITVAFTDILNNDLGKRSYQYAYNPGSIYLQVVGVDLFHVYQGTPVKMRAQQNTGSTLTVYSANQNYNRFTIRAVPEVIVDERPV